MSTVWLIGSPNEWLDELALILSGLTGVRRIAGLRTFIRLCSMGDIPADGQFHCVLRPDPDENVLSLHAAISKFLTQFEPSQMSIIGELSAEHRQLASALKIECLCIPVDLHAGSIMIRDRARASFSLKKYIISDDYIRVGDIEVDRAKASMRIMATGVEEPLTPKEIRILQVLSASVNQSVGRDELIQRVWAGMRVSASTVDSHMSRLRKKIEHSFECRLETKYGSGWVLSMTNSA